MSLAGWRALRTPSRPDPNSLPSRASHKVSREPWRGLASCSRALAPFPACPRILRLGLPRRWPSDGLRLNSMAEIHARILPTEWEAAALMPRLCETLQPHVMIYFGVSEHAKTFRIERSAHNRAAPRADARGALPASPVILAEGADRLDTAFPAGALAAASQDERRCRRDLPLGGALSLQLSLLPLARLGSAATGPSSRAVRAHSASVRQRRSVQRGAAACMARKRSCASSSPSPASRLRRNRSVARPSLKPKPCSAQRTLKRWALDAGNS